MITAFLKVDGQKLELVGRWNQQDLPMIDDEAFSDLWGYTDSNGVEYVMMASLDSIYFLNVQDPGNPILCDVEAGKSRNVIHRDIKTYKHYAYAHGDEGYSSLQIFDLQYLPDSVHKVYDNDEFAYRCHNLFIDSNLLYLASVRSWQAVHPMRVLSLDNPEKPTLFSDLVAPSPDGQPLFNEVHDLYVRDDTAYCSMGNDGMYFYAVDRENKSLELVTNGVITRYPSRGYNHSSCLNEQGTHLFLIDETHGTRLKSISIRTGGVPDVRSTFGSNSDKGSIAHNPAVRGDYLFVSYYHEGVLLYDISKPDSPKTLDQYDTYPSNVNYNGMYGCWGVYPFFPSGLVAASDQRNGLFLFQVTVGAGKRPEEKPYELKRTWGGFALAKTNQELNWELISLSGQLLLKGEGSSFIAGSLLRNKPALLRIRNGQSVYFEKLLY